MNIPPPPPPPAPQPWHQRGAFIVIAFLLLAGAAAGVTVLLTGGDSPRSVSPASGPGSADDTTPIETDPVETEATTPVETDPFETDPVETDPVETDPVETDPAETDPADTTPDDTTPADTALTPANQAALDELEGLRERDRPTIEIQLLDKWVPQTAARRVGLNEDGIEASANDVLNNHQEWVEFDGSLVIWSGDYVGFDSDDLWVSLAPIWFDSPEEALNWCVINHLGPNDCYARYITHDDSLGNTEVFQP